MTRAVTITLNDAEADIIDRLATASVKMLGEPGLTADQIAGHLLRDHVFRYTARPGC